MFHNMKISHNKYSWANFIRMFFFLHFVWQLNSDSETLVLWNGWSVDDTLVSLYSSKFTFQRPNGDFYKSDLISTRMKSNKYIGKFLLCKVG